MRNWIAAPRLELFHEAQHHLNEGQTLYALGQLALADRARLDDLFYAIANAVRARLLPAERAHRAALGRAGREARRQVLRQLLGVRVDPGCVGDRPDFPDRADRAAGRGADRRGVIVDLTCDSDGRIDHYVDAEAST